MGAIARVCGTRDFCDYIAALSEKCIDSEATRRLSERSGSELSRSFHRFITYLRLRKICRLDDCTACGTPSQLTPSTSQGSRYSAAARMVNRVAGVEAEIALPQSRKAWRRQYEKKVDS